MKERPILFSGPMVRAILEGRKTQTRRIIKGLIKSVEQGDNGAWHMRTSCGSYSKIKCTYGDVGDTLWVRENFQTLGRWERVALGETGDGENRWERSSNSVWYSADGTPPEPGTDKIDWRGMPSIHMRRDDSRIDLAVQTVRAERLNDITEQDAIAEGITYGMDDAYWSGAQGFIGHETAVSAFIELWESINGAHSWIVNPWVWVVDFKLLQKKCPGCGVHYAPDGKICDGCEAYSEHQA